MKLTRDKLWLGMIPALVGLATLAGLGAVATIPAVG